MSKQTLEGRVEALETTNLALVSLVREMNDLLRRLQQEVGSTRELAVSAAQNAAAVLAAHDPSLIDGDPAHGKMEH